MFLIAVTALAFTACDNAADAEKRKQDSLDSIAKEQKNAIDSTAEERKDAIDSMRDKSKDSLDRLDSLKDKKDTGRKSY